MAGPPRELRACPPTAHLHPHPSNPNQHNQEPSSSLRPDITFGLALNYTVPSKRGATLNIAVADGTITVTWNGNGFTLQHASAPEGSWADVPGPIQSSPYTTNNAGSKRFFRLR